MTKIELKDRSIVNPDFELNPASKLIIIKENQRSIEELKKTSADKESDEVKRLQSEVIGQLEQLRKEISGGASTGHKFTDFIIRFIAHNEYDEQIEKQYLEISSRFEKHQGERILMQNFATEATKKVIKFKLGIIKKQGSEIDSKFGRILLADKAITFESENLDDKIHQTKNFRKLEKLYLYWYEKPVVANLEKSKINIFIGDKEVNKKLQNFKINIEQVKYFSPVLAQHLKTS